MADQPVPRGSSSPGSPGVSGAIKDAIGALAGALAPKSITQRKPKINQAVEDAQQSSQSPQTTDLGNQF